MVHPYLILDCPHKEGEKRHVETFEITSAGPRINGPFFRRTLRKPPQASLVSLFIFVERKAAQLNKVPCLRNVKTATRVSLSVDAAVKLDNGNEQRREHVVQR